MAVLLPPKEAETDELQSGRATLERTPGGDGGSEHRDARCDWKQSQGAQPVA